MLLKNVENGSTGVTILADVDVRYCNLFFSTLPFHTHTWVVGTLRTGTTLRPPVPRLKTVRL
jgi:hypothetical protein